jgi:hypothetical protein
MLFTTPPCGFGLVIDSITARPTSSALGTSVTGHASADTKSSYQEIFSAASVTHDVYAVRIACGVLGVNGETRMVLADFATDPAGGTSYSPVINNLGYMPHNTSFTSAQQYFFPLFIKAGSSIAIRQQCGTAAVNCQYRVWLYCKPTRPESWRVGTFVTTYGATTASTTGTAVTPGTTSEGSWTVLGSTSSKHWYWQACALIDDSTITANQVYDCDLGVGSGGSADVVIQGMSYYATSGETLSQLNTPSMNECVNETPQSWVVYGRAQCSGTADSNFSMIAYGLGG